MGAVDTARIRWRCRRGLKELDVLMERLVAERLQQLSPELTRALNRLLDETDLDLLDWIIGRSPPRSPEYLPLLEILRGLNR